MKNLTEIRERLNQIDDEIVRLFVERLTAMEEVATAKKIQKLPLYDAERERAILCLLQEHTPVEYRDYIEKLYEKIFDCCKERQQTFLAERDGK